jgi:hypothetical protein
MKPIFLFSLPRSGSTLLQRMLATHPKITTSAEPWILLPLVYLRKQKGSFTEYWHYQTSLAINDILQSRDGGEFVYKQAVRSFANSIYAHAALNTAAEFFVDKTPRYHLIVDEIAELYPDSKFIFLWRNPLAVAASMSNTWASGKWNAYDYYVDLYSGTENLCAAAKSHADRSLSVRYEDLVSSPETALRELFSFLQLEDWAPAAKSFSKIKLIGRMQDPSGVKNFKSVNEARADDWRAFYLNPVRKLWARHYLAWIGNGRLGRMGYSVDALLETLKVQPSSLRLVASDLIRIIYGVIAGVIEPKFIRGKFLDKKLFRICARHQ